MKIRSAMICLMTVWLALWGTVPAFAEEIYTPSEQTLQAMEEDYYRIEPVDPELLSYSSYYDLYCNEGHPDAGIRMGAENFSSLDGSAVLVSHKAEGVTKDALVWKKNSGKVSAVVAVPETGIYCLRIDYCPLAQTSQTIEISLEIDGKLPFEQASRLTLGRVWVDEKGIYDNFRGNQIRSPQVQQESYKSVLAGDPDGLFGEPLIFFLEKGKHEISVSSGAGQLALASLSFETSPEIPSYEEYKASVKSSVTPETTPSRLFRIEGESAAVKSDATLCANFDNTNYLVSPSDPSRIVYNTFGGSGWGKPLQTVTWNISKEDVGNDGWYRIGIKYRQNFQRGFVSNRRIYIDGRVICGEMNQVRFSYDSDWSVASPDILVYLDSGSAHTLTMEVVPGETGEYLRRLEEVLAEINVQYRKILMITGPAPDKYTDYYVHEKIPDLTERLKELSAELKDIQDDMEKLGGSYGSEAAVLENTAVILDKCVKKPIEIPSYLARIKDSITSLSAWMRECREQPLEIDYIEFASADRKFTSCEKKIIKSAEFSFKAFISSFFQDYTTLSDITGESAIEVWVALGRDQAEIVREMTESQFIPEYGIPVSVNLVNGGIVEAALAGKAPDAALFLGGEFPVNLASRGLLTDFSQYDDFSDVSQKFGESAMVQYSWDGGCYGIPISRSFPMMFYRTDILSELGYDHPPETWDELMEILPAIQRNYMNTGLVLPPNNISPATEAGHTFAMLMLQNGCGYYNDDLTATSFDSVEAYRCFEQWTDFYTKYSFEQSYDAFSRFRTGEYPIVIANYTFFNQLEAASPEIRGLWNFCQVPGTLRADGTVSHAVNSSGSGAVVFSSAENQDGAWEFVKWFTSTEVQTELGMRLEGLNGVMGRFDTADPQALRQLSWSEEELSRLMDQYEELAEIPIIPSSYAVTRNIMNAFREVVNDGENPRDTLLWYNRDINDEIERKNEVMNKRGG